MSKVAKYTMIFLALIGLSSLITVSVIAISNTDRGPTYDKWGRRVISKDIRMFNAQDAIETRDIIVAKGKSCDYVSKGWIDYRNYTITAVCNDGKVSYKITGEVKTNELQVYKI